jgi:hypothetical protein
LVIHTRANDSKANDIGKLFKGINTWKINEEVGIKDFIWRPRGTFDSESME